MEVVADDASQVDGDVAVIDLCDIFPWHQCRSFKCTGDRRDFILKSI